jgi:hypothetical protein
MLGHLQRQLTDGVATDLCRLDDAEEQSETPTSQSVAAIHDPQAEARVVTTRGYRGLASIYSLNSFDNAD